MQQSEELVGNVRDALARVRLWDGDNAREVLTRAELDALARAALSAMPDEVGDHTAKAIYREGWIDGVVTERSKWRAAGFYTAAQCARAEEEAEIDRDFAQSCWREAIKAGAHRGEG